jgi:hypothetical protein
LLDDIQFTADIFGSIDSNTRRRCSRTGRAVLVPTGDSQRNIPPSCQLPASPSSRRSIEFTGRFSRIDRFTGRSDRFTAFHHAVLHQITRFTAEHSAIVPFFEIESDYRHTTGHSAGSIEFIVFVRCTASLQALQRNVSSHRAAGSSAAVL